TTTRGAMTGTFAVMTGGGRDIPQRYLPEELGTPMLVTRFGYNDGLDKDIYVNALYIKDSSIGHSTVVNAPATDKNLLINGNYNPFIGKAPFSLSTIWQ